ncbi:formate dehydrogenase accessory sulfurtransferase FdhD [Nesterenkonia sp. MY13]|uniref:Sulfur carrier protein FdhD n=1 Tax=Nesterenkonia sedimenti TaxID=1463632 RepID=A0A7X8YCV7_9MICC|nr:formate dehydrogenase accessory sulfurtransferase FdhD [Nesterenkonia sedimenti]NLS08979.1 formate dehydrogenase accessory sulfurtransferase FdhD [Nesterenkonia sedimenti]
MGRLTQRRRITRIRRTEEGITSATRPDALAAEEPLELRIGGESFTVTMRTPGHDFELAAGFCVAEGLLRSTDDLAGADQLRSMRYCAGTDDQGNQTYNVIDLELADPAAMATAVSQQRNVLTSSACGICGTTSIDAVEKSLPHAEATQELSISAETLLDLPGALREAQEIFAKTGGVHAAGLFDGEGKLLILREDVGRHNAVDKVIGRAFLDDQLPLSGTALQVSGRASFELVQKAALAGVEMLTAVGAPSSLAADLADRAGITLAGFSRGRTINLYTHPERVRF